MASLMLRLGWPPAVAWACTPDDLILLSDATGRQAWQIAPLTSTELASLQHQLEDRDGDDVCGATG